MKDYYKYCPFEFGVLYTEGLYKGRYDAWNNYFGSFIFQCNGEERLVHPKEVDRIKSISKL